MCKEVNLPEGDSHLSMKRKQVYWDTDGVWDGCDTNFVRQMQIVEMEMKSNVKSVWEVEDEVLKKDIFPS
jgi:hypothetical protein